MTVVVRRFDKNKLLTPACAQGSETAAQGCVGDGVWLDFVAGAVDFCLLTL